MCHMYTSSRKHGFEVSKWYYNYYIYIFIHHNMIENTVLLSAVIGIYFHLCIVYSFLPNVWNSELIMGSRYICAWIIKDNFIVNCIALCKAFPVRHWSVSLWRDPDGVSHCRILSPDKTEWRLISDTLCGWRRCFVADQLWLMTRVREEEEVRHSLRRKHLMLIVCNACNNVNKKYITEVSPASLQQLMRCHGVLLMPMHDHCVVRWLSQPRALMLYLLDHCLFQPRILQTRAKL